MTELVRPWRGVSADERRAERDTRLREACLEVVGSRGVSGATVDLVCAEAGLTKRYLYEGFTGLDELLVAITDDLVADLRTRMEAALASCSTGRERSRAIVTILVEVLSEDARRARLYSESAGHSLLRQRRDTANDAFTDFVVADVLNPPTSPAAAARRWLATRLVVAGTTDLVSSWLRGDIEADREAVIETILHVGGSA